MRKKSHRYLNMSEKGKTNIFKVSYLLFTFFCKFYEIQLEENKGTANNDEREILSLSGHCRTVQHDIEMIKEQLENISESASDLKRKLARANANLKHW
jgi:peptidoglycan hydrolase CwlO-like protein